MPTLQEQINATPAGGTLTLADGSEHVGNFVFPRPITVQGRATLISPNAAPAIDIPLKARGVSFTDISAKSSHYMVYDIVRIGTWQNSVVEDCPTDVTFNRCDIYGIEGQQVQRGIAGNGANIQVLNSKIREIHGKGLETQAFGAWNGPGPFKIIDSYLEASGENIMFGGSDASIPNLVASDIEVRRCKMFKPLTWRGVYSVKNIFELKNARRVVVDGCVLENCWGDAQIGFGVLFTTRNQDGKNPWAVVEDVEFTNNEVLNVAGGFQLIGKDYPNASAQGSRIRIANNIIRLAQNGALGPNGRLLQMERTKDVTFENNDANPDHTIIVFSGEEQQPGLVYRKNLLTVGGYGVTPASLVPKDAMTRYAPGHDFSANMLIAPTDLSRLYPVGNTFVTSRPDPVPAGVGVDMAALKAAQEGLSSAPLPTEPTPAPKPEPDPIPEQPIPIAPSPDGTKAMKIVDAQGGVWTIGDGNKTLRDGIHMGGGTGYEYKYVSSVVYVQGTDAAKNWYKWTGASWVFHGAEPGVTQPAPVPAPEPAPTPTPSPVPASRVLVWPSTESAQTTLWQGQAKEGYRPNRHVARPANMPKGNYVEFVKF